MRNWNPRNAPLRVPHAPFDRTAVFGTASDDFGLFDAFGEFHRPIDRLSAVISPVSGKVRFGLLFENTSREIDLIQRRLHSLPVSIDEVANVRFGELLGVRCESSLMSDGELFSLVAEAFLANDFRPIAAEAKFTYSRRRAFVMVGIGDLRHVGEVLKGIRNDRRIEKLLWR